VNLKPFQLEGAAFLAARTRALLADEPGVGKTAQIITAANLAGANSLGVVCPGIGTRHWEREADKWNYQGDRLDIIPWGDAHEFAGGGWRWDVLISDEAHFGKNPNARRTAAVFAKGGLAWYTDRIWAASGTPSPNNAAELWPMLRAFGKTPMDLEQFKRYFCHVDARGKVRGNRPDRIEELRAILKSFSLRRLKKDVLPELGAIDIQEWYVKPNADFALARGIPLRDGAIAENEEEALRAQLQGKSDEELLSFLAGGAEFSTLRRYNALLKAPAVYETVKFELENGLLDKVVIYGYHPEAMQSLHEAFWRANIPSTLIIGSTPQGSRYGLIEDWKRKGKVLIASSIIASTVLDFTAAHQGIMLEMDWVPGNNSQAMQRMHRHGQENPVTVRVAIGTPVDEIVSGVLIRKARDLAEIYD
jgi:SWI/SNF-related matrix-associated actin-dependent regulator 1 of chromatin subfamily A